MFATEDASSDQIAGTVTRITPLRKQPGHYAIAIDDRAAFTLTQEALVRFDIQLGDQLSAARVAEMIAADETARATESALVFLAYRPRSEREVRDRLRRAGYSAESIEAVIGRLHAGLKVERHIDRAAGDFCSRSSGRKGSTRKRCAKSSRMRTLTKWRRR